MVVEEVVQSQSQVQVQVQTLSYIEKKILDFMASKPGIILSIDMIGKSVYGYRVNPALIRVHVYRIREKIGPVIATVRGHGYAYDSRVCDTCHGSGYVANGIVANGTVANGA